MTKFTIECDNECEAKRYIHSTDAWSALWDIGEIIRRYRKEGAIDNAMIGVLISDIIEKVEESNVYDVWK